jgi:thiamine-phosphate pyrophosphorylase
VLRVVAITDLATCAMPELGDRLRAILAAVPPGSVRLQLRKRRLDGGPLLALARELIAIARPLGAEVWINDRADVALAAGADGVHLPERGLAIAEARALGLRTGASRHSAESAVAAARDGADVVHLGPIFATPAKPSPLGTDALAVRLPVPLIAVGGIDSPERAREAVRAGADAVAVIRAAWTSADPAATIAAICEAIASR